LSGGENLTVYGFSKFSQSSVDSTHPAGEVIGTNPPACPAVPLAVIELQVSKGNQFVMPELMGLFWVDAEPQLRALGTRRLRQRSSGPAGSWWSSGNTRTWTTRLGESRRLWRAVARRGTGRDPTASTAQGRRRTKRSEPKGSTRTTQPCERRSTLCGGSWSYSPMSDGPIT
jgi:hypothetical protein